MMLNNSSFEISLPEVKQGQILTIGTFSSADIVVPHSIFNMYGAAAPLSAGQLFCHVSESSPPLLRILSRGFFPIASKEHADTHELPCCYAEVLHPCSEKVTVATRKEGFSLAWVTLSDKGSRGERVDESGPAIQEDASKVLPIAYTQGFILPDTPSRLRSLVLDLASHQGFDLIITTGGTGLGPRDTTPEALIPLLSRRLAGFEQAMMMASLQKTPSASISRAFAGTIEQSLVISLPGSKKAVRENLAAVLPAVKHAIDKLQGDPSDCALLF